jgi:hypothetical protein
MFYETSNYHLRKCVLKCRVGYQIILTNKCATLCEVRYMQILVCYFWIGGLNMIICNAYHSVQAHEMCGPQTCHSMPTTGM